MRDEQHGATQYQNSIARHPGSNASPVHAGLPSAQCTCSLNEQAGLPLSAEQAFLNPQAGMPPVHSEVLWYLSLHFASTLAILPNLIVPYSHLTSCMAAALCGLAQPGPQKHSDTSWPALQHLQTTAWAATEESMSLQGVPTAVESPAWPVLLLLELSAVEMVPEQAKVVGSNHTLHSRVRLLQQLQHATACKWTSCTDMIRTGPRTSQVLAGDYR